MIFFISGHRDITEQEFKEHYIPWIDSIFDDVNYPEFVVGDCEGVDKMAMDYLAPLAFNREAYINIYHMGDSPRHTPDNVPINYTERCFSDYVTFHGGYNSDETRDSAMTKDSHFDIAWVRKGKENSGTAQNIKRRYGFK